MKELLEFLYSFNLKLFSEKIYIDSALPDGKNRVSTQFKLESRDPSFSIKIMEIIKKFKGIIKIEIV